MSSLMTAKPKFGYTLNSHDIGILALDGIQIIRDDNKAD